MGRGVERARNASRAVDLTRHPDPPIAHDRSRSARSAKASPREVALEALTAVLRGGRGLEGDLGDRSTFERLSPRDRGFARLLVATTLRRLGQIDALIGRCLQRPIPSRSDVVTDALRLGVCQLVFLRTPPHAAVDTAVGVVRARGRSGFAGLVNAVLRRLSVEGADLAAAQDAPRVNTPEWLWRSWSDAYGEAAARAIATVHLEEPPLDLSFKEGGAEAWRPRLDAAPTPTGGLRLAHVGPVAELPGFEEGAWWVQDAAARLPAQLLGDVRDRVVLDLCAAPGGKTMQLAAAGARVVAVDRSPARVARIAANLARVRLDARPVEADVAAWRPDEPADAALLDVPCSSTGAARRHPDVLRRKTGDEVAALVPTQGALLRAAAEMVRDGGRIVYATCSLQIEEGEGVVDRVIAEGAPLVREPLGPGDVGGMAGVVTARGDLRTLPHQLADAGGWDGFFAARLRRLPR